MTVAGQWDEARRWRHRVFMSCSHALRDLQNDDLRKAVAKRVSEIVQPEMTRTEMHTAIFGGLKGMAPKAVRSRVAAYLSTVITEL